MLQAKERAIRLNNEGNSLLSTGNYEAAIERYEQVARLYPGLAHARFNVANALFLRAHSLSQGPPETAASSLQDYAAAAEHFSRATYLSPKNPDFYRRLGEALAASNVRAISDKHFTSGTRGFPVSEAVIHRSRQAMQTAIQMAPNSFESVLSLGNLYLDQVKDLKAAAFHYRVAVRLNPNSGIAYSNLATALMQSGESEKLSEVIVNFKEALRLVPVEAVSYNDLAYALMQQGRHEEAIPILEAALTITPDAGQIHINLGTSRAFVRRNNPLLATNTSCLRRDDEERIPVWHLCEALWQEAKIRSRQVRFIVFEAAMRRSPQGGATISILSFLEGYPAATAPGGHALLSPVAYTWGKMQTLQCGVEAKGIVASSEAQILLDPPHAMRIECNFPQMKIHRGDKLHVRLSDAVLGVEMRLQLCQGGSQADPPADSALAAGSSVKTGHQHRLAICTMPLFPPLPQSLLTEWLDGVGQPPSSR